VSKHPKLETLRILHYPDPRLRERAAEIRAIDGFLQELAHRMDELMKEAGGVGLAATQVGLGIRFIVMNPTPEPDKVQTYINPVILSREGKVMEEEGCLSLPGLFAKVRRAERVRVRAQLPNGETVEMEADGLAARAWQHEIDHLDGGLFVDRVGPAARIIIRNQLKAFEEDFRQASSHVGTAESDAPPAPASEKTRTRKART